MITDVPKETKIMDIKKAGIIGSGTMGGGIAMCFANAGIPVHIIDQDEDNLKRGISVIEKNYEFMVNRGRLTSEQKDSVFGLVSSSPGLPIATIVPLLSIATLKPNCSFCVGA